MHPAMTAFCFALSLSSLVAQTPAAPDTKRIPVQFIWDLKIPMRDKVNLSATVYRDPKQTKPLPVILTLTPYIAEHAARQGTYFAQNGYIFVAVDLRGRGNSEGVFLPGQVEAKDGYDVVEWIAKQPWCDGQVATWGGSWLGFAQWSIAKEFPPHLKAMSPTASVHPGVDYPQPKGIFMSYMLPWLTYVHGRALNSGIFGASPLWSNAEWEQVSTGRPFQDLEDLTGAKGTVFRTWLSHPREDAFWKAMTPQPQDYAKLQIPILTITGHFDADQEGALAYYDRHMAHGLTKTTQQHWLVLGPWNHGGTRRPTAELGGVNFGPGAAMSMEELHKAWYDHVLKGGPRPAFLKDRVACFIMGRNTWIYAPDLKQIEGSPLRLELDLSGSVAGDITRGGHMLTQSTAASASVTLTSDPRYLPPPEERDRENPQFLKDQREAYGTLPNQILWHSAPFQEETVLAGRARMKLRLACDQPDADLWLEMQEVLPDGGSLSLTHGAIRLRYRKGGVDGVPMKPGQPELVDFPNLDFFARSIGKGSRLRLVMNAGPSLGWQRNTHTGGNLATEPLSAGRVANITLMTGPGTGSVIEIPRPDPALLKPKEETSKAH